MSLAHASDFYRSESFEADFAHLETDDSWRLQNKSYGMIHFLTIPDMVNEILRPENRNGISRRGMGGVIDGKVQLKIQLSAGQQFLPDGELTDINMNPLIVQQISVIPGMRRRGLAASALAEIARAASPRRVVVQSVQSSYIEKALASLGGKSDMFASGNVWLALPGPTRSELPLTHHRSPVGGRSANNPTGGRPAAPLRPQTRAQTRTTFTNPRVQRELFPPVSVLDPFADSGSESD